MTSPEDLRRGAARLFDATTDRSDMVLRPGETLIAEVPTGGKNCRPTVLAMTRRPHGYKNELLLQVYLVGPGGQRVAVSGALFISTSSLPLLADAVAKAMEIELATVEGRRDSRPSAPEEGGSAP